jgi:hypothetical protein
MMIRNPLEPKRTCGAQTNAGTPCKVAPMPNGRCHKHGGASPAPGPAHPNYKHGRYSKAMPERLYEGFSNALNDPDLLNRRTDLALVSSRIEELLNKLRAGEGGATLHQRLKELAQVYRQTGRISEPARRMQAQADSIMEILRTIESTPGDELWTEIGEMVDRFNRVADGDRKRMIALHATITADQAMVMIDNLSRIVLSHVTDSKLRSAIGRDFAAFVSRVLGGSVQPADDARRIGGTVRPVAVEGFATS